MLGNADHGDGSDFLAETRLVRFLHQHLGFDVLAFDSGIYDMSLVWPAIRQGEPPREAFDRGLWFFWSRSEQMQPLIKYVAGSANSNQPLEVAGFDFQFSSGPQTPRILAANLAQFMDANGLGGPLADRSSLESEILADLMLYRGWGEEQKAHPDSLIQQRFLQSLRLTVDAIEASVATRDAMFWAQILRSTAEFAASVFDTTLTFGQRSEWRDHQMARNLVWLADEYYAGRRIIAWDATSHITRNLTSIEGGPWWFGEVEQSYAMGDGVWAALGEESFSIAFTSYRGSHGWAGAPPYDVVPDQSPFAEFEELMALAGHDFALVDLRSAAEEGSWLGATFIARPLGHIAQRARWSESLDALFFIREQQPSRRNQE